MEKLPKIIYETVPPVKLYLDDLQEIETLLKEHYGDKIEIRTKEYKFNSVDGLQQLDEPKIYHLKISVGEGIFASDVEMELKRSEATIFCRTDTPKDHGIVNKLKELLLNRKRLARKLRPLWFLCLIASLVVLYLFQRYSTSLPIILVLAIIALILVTLQLWIVLADIRYHCIIIPKWKRDAPSFWTRNKDQIWLLIIGAIVGAIITAIVTLLLK